MDNNKGFWKGLLAGLILAAAMLVVVLFGSKAYRLVTGVQTVSSNVSVVNRDTTKKVQLIEQIMKTYYLNDVDESTMEEGMYKGIVESLGDPYSTYYTKDELNSMLETSSGIYYGVGLYLAQDPETMIIKVVRPIKDSPASEMGIQAEDILSEVDHESIVGEDVSEVVAKVKGKAGTKVILTMLRDGKPMDFEIERRSIEAETVDYEMKDNQIGYILISEFDDVTYTQFNAALAELTKQGMESLILDLRGNPGGNLDTVVDIAEQMLPEGMIVYTEDKQGEREEYTSDGKHEFNKPLVVLVDENSASAAEILAGAIKDYGLGSLVGKTTFGKGIVQRIIPLDDGTAVKLTISKYYTPSGNNIHKIGIKPDVEVDFDYDAYEKDGTDNQLNKAIEVLKKEKREE